MLGVAGHRRVLGGSRYPTARDIARLAPAAWFRFGRGITVATGVSQWDDASGNGRHLKQATGTNQPALQSDGTILFDGADNYLKCDAFTLNRPYHIYLLVKQVAWTINRYFFDGNTANRFSVVQVTVTPQICMTDSVLISSTSSDLAVGAYGVVSVSNTGTSGTFQVNNNTAITGTTAGNEMGGFTLAANGANLAHSNIQVKEVIIFPAAHNTTQRAQVYGYLKRLGGL